MCANVTDMNPPPRMWTEVTYGRKMTVIGHHPGPYGQTVVTLLPTEYAHLIVTTNQGNVQDEDGNYAWSN